MFEVSKLLQFLDIIDSTVVISSNFKIVSSFVWALIKDISYRWCDSDLIAPIALADLEWLILRHNFARVVLDRFAKIRLVQFYCHPSVFLKVNINLAILVDSNINPGSTTVFRWPFDNYSLSVQKPLSCTKVMWRVNRVH